MNFWTLDAVDPATGVVTPRPLPLDGPEARCRVLLRALPGARGLYLRCRREGAPVACFELPEVGSDAVAVELEVSASGGLFASSAHHTLFTLPASPSPAPPAPWVVPPATAPRDVLFVVDATTRCLDDEAATGLPQLCTLLADSARWSAAVGRLVELGRWLAQGQNGRFDVLAFADDPTAPVDALDLKPRFVRWPPTPLVARPFSPRALRERLLAVPPSPGADFVDALADALAHARVFPWRPGASRWLVLVGDSPGHSLLHPAPAGADLLVRGETIEAALAELHREGVIRLSLYLGFDPTRLPAAAAHSGLLAYSRDQYRSIASTPALGFDGESCDLRRVARELTHLPPVLGYGVAIGELVAVAAVELLTAGSLEGGSDSFE